MAHKHSVYDTDLHFKIDNVTRNITSESGKVILMQNDHNSERFTFEIPRMVDGHDMSVCNLVEVHYINTDSANKRNQSKDVYPVTDLQISPDSDDVVIGSWLISQNATMYAGTLHFLLRYACIADDEEATIDYQWFTNIYSVITIAKGIYNTDVVTDDGDSDTLAAWKAEILAMTEPYVESAITSASNAAVSEINAKTSELNAKESEINAKTSETNSKESETNAKTSEENARSSEINAKYSEEFTANVVTQIDNLNDEVLENLREVSDAVDEYNARIGNTTFTVNLETGNLEYESPDYIFYVNEETGNLEWETMHEHSNAAEVLVEDIRTEKSDAIVLTASGESIVVNNSSNDHVRGLRIFGRTEQITTTGKNLFNINADVAVDYVTYSRDNESITITTGSELNADGYARLMFENIRVDSGKTYTISFDTDSTAEVTIGWYGCAKTANLSGKTHYEVTLSNITTATFSVGILVPNTTVIFSNIQIEEGTVETSYEPYTGGVASPSPTYRQRLKTIGVGKNLLQNTAKNLTYGGVTFTVNSDGSVVANGTATEILFFKINSIELKKGVSYILSGCPADGNNATYSIKVDMADGSALDYGTGVTIVGDGRTDCPVNLRITQGTTVNNLVFKPMIRYADIEDSVYEPYGKDDVEVTVSGVESQTITVLTPNGLPGIKVTDTALATYTDDNGQMWCADEIDFERGVYVKRIETLNVNGSAKVERRNTVNGAAKTRIKILDIVDSPAHSDNNTKGVVLCDKLVTKTASNTYNCQEGISIDNYGSVLLYVDELSEFTLEEIGAWLDANPLAISYALATPIERSLFKEELAAYKSLHMNHPTTTVINDSDAYMELEYNADVKSYIDFKMEELKALLTANK